jgi:hypothetical protein
MVWLSITVWQKWIKRRPIIILCRAQLKSHERGCSQFGLQTKNVLTALSWLTWHHNFIFYYYFAKFLKWRRCCATRTRQINNIGPGHEMESKISDLKVTFWYKKQIGCANGAHEYFSHFANYRKHLRNSVFLFVCSVSLGFQSEQFYSLLKKVPS